MFHDILLDKESFIYKSKVLFVHAVKVCVCVRVIPPLSLNLKMSGHVYIAANFLPGKRPLYLFGGPQGHPGSFGRMKSLVPTYN